jgi:hypothetical protein
LADAVIKLKIFAGKIPFVKSAQSLQGTFPAEEPKHVVDEFLPLGIENGLSPHTQKTGHRPSNGLTNQTLAYGILYPSDIGGTCGIEQMQTGTEIIAIILGVCPNNGYILAPGFLEAQVESVDLDAVRIRQQADTVVSLCDVLKDGHCPVVTPAIEHQNFVHARYVLLRQER